MLLICPATIKLDKAFYWTAEAYLRRHDMSPACFGQRSLGDCFAVVMPVEREEHARRNQCTC